MTKRSLRITSGGKKGGEPKDMGVLSFAKLIGAISAAILPIFALATWYVNATVNSAIARQQAEIQKAMTEIQLKIDSTNNGQGEAIARLQERVDENQRQITLLWQRRSGPPKR